ncbi:cell wall-binding repeat-containing protein [Clostridium mobile]
MKKIFSLVVATIFTFGFVGTAYAQDTYNVKRLYGMDRYKTSASISNKFNDETTNNVIVASGKNFPDALAGSVLSKKLNAPILLVGNTSNERKDSIEYINSHLDKNGTVYILGGQGSVNEEFINNMKSQGYKNFVRLGGKDRFDTNKHIVNFMNVEKHTPVVVVNAYGFADALSVSSIAASKGYPIIMTSNSSLSPEGKSMIKNIEPSEVYIIGGHASVGDKVISEIKTLIPSLDNSKIIKLAGADRYDTSLKVCNRFNLDTDTAILANGSNFPDALSGSALAAKFDAPIILTNGQDITKQREFLNDRSYKNIFLLGGSGSIDFLVEYSLKGKENTTKEERDYINKLIEYCDKYTSENTSASNDIVNLFNSISLEEVFGKLEDPNTFIEALEQLINIYNDCIISLEDYKEKLVNIKNEISTLGNLNGLETFSLEYINVIDIEIKNVDKVIKMTSDCKYYFRSLKSAMESGDLNKIEKALKDLENMDIDAVNELTKLESVQIGINKLKDKLVNIKNMIN